MIVFTVSWPKETSKNSKCQKFGPFVSRLRRPRLCADWVTQNPATERKPTAGLSILNMYLCFMHNVFFFCSSSCICKTLPFSPFTSNVESLRLSGALLSLLFNLHNGLVRTAPVDLIDLSALSPSEWEWQWVTQKRSQQIFFKRKVETTWRHFSTRFSVTLGKSLNWFTLKENSTLLVVSVWNVNSGCFLLVEDPPTVPQLNFRLQIVATDPVGSEVSNLSNLQTKSQP